MPIFKYTVANKEGKKLSGTVESPDEKTARTELNNLGFSILMLTETQEETKLNPNLKKFIFEAVDKNSTLLSGSIPAEKEEEALERLEDEYNLTITAIWEENAPEEKIAAAKTAGSLRLQEKLKFELEESKNKSLEEQREEAFIKSKIENLLKQISDLLQKFDQDFNPEQKAEIHKRINKLLRIKNSLNFEYILSTGHELLLFIQDQEKNLREKGLKEKEFELKIRTKNLLDELKQSSAPASLSEDILRRIEKWEYTHRESASFFTKLIAKLIIRLKNFFTTPQEIQIIKAQIKTYNKQLIEFTKLYFKEPTKEYKAKVRSALGTIWRARKKAKSSLKYVKQLIKTRRRKAPENLGENENIITSFVKELNSLSGWLLFFYLAYYFIALYLNSKDFGLTNIPQGLKVYDSHIFKYILVILFLLHTTTSLKVNYLSKSFVGSLLLIPFFIITSILTLLNL